MKTKQKLALLVIGALLVSLLPMGNATVSRAEHTSVATSGKTTLSGDGLNNPATDKDGITTWDCVYFGSYWQEDTNGDGKADQEDAKQSIKWRVLSVNGEDAFLVADKILDVQKYNDGMSSGMWETCRMRSWLNGYGAESNVEGIDYSGSGWIDRAFTAGEQSAIRITKVKNMDNPIFDTEAGDDTEDQIYLLSIDEVMNPFYGFTSINNSTETREALRSFYAACGGEMGSDDVNSSEVTNSSWWLRSPGEDSIRAAFVRENGSMDRKGTYIYGNGLSVRPALHLDLSAVSNWTYAGTVTSEGGEIGTVSPTLVPAAKPTTTPGTLSPPITDSPSETSAPTAEPGGTVIETPAVTAKPFATAVPTEKPETAATVKPASPATMSPAVTAAPGSAPTPASPSVSLVPTEEPGSEATEIPTAKPAETPGADISPTPASPSVSLAPTEKPDEPQGTVTPFVQAPMLQTNAQVLQKPASSAATNVGTAVSIKLKQKNQTVTVSWKKVPGAAGYQICYSTSKKWKGKKQKLLRKNKVTVKKLKKKKIYYFRVRAYRLDGTKKVYGTWSKTKKIRMKK